MKEDYVKIIKKAENFLKGSTNLRSKIFYLSLSNFSYLKNEEEYQKLCGIFGALVRDYTKILVTLNNIEKIYSEYQRDEYRNIYEENFNLNSPNLQLGCFIEYLFIKYRVIFEYIQELLTLTLPNRFNEFEKKKFKSFKKRYDQYEFLLKFIYNNISDEKKEFLNIEWLKNIITNRNFLIHQGANCIACANKKNDLIFQINTRDPLICKELVEGNTFYTNPDTNFIYYSRYWGLQLSRLIIYLETILDFIAKDAQFDTDYKRICDLGLGKNLEFRDDKETVLKNILTNCISTSYSNRIIKGAQFDDTEALKNILKDLNINY